MANKASLLNKIFAFLLSRSQGDRFLFFVIFLTFLGSSLYSLHAWNENTLVAIPHEGGMLVEGIVGTPRFINPLLAVTNADRDMTTLIYAGLMRLGPDGVLVPDMAESVTVSDDGLTYNVILREDVAFHDGTPVTADDVIFTINRVQDSALKSPLRSSWNGVAIERLSETELNFVLDKPYAPFMENLTLGILPRHIWEYATIEEFPFSQYNSEPIGSGPYKVITLNRTRSGIPESYELEPASGYTPMHARISHLELRFFPSEEALTKELVAGEIDSAAGLSPETLATLDLPKMGKTLYRTPLPRTFAVFFNQNEVPLFRDRSVRKALDLAIDRTAIVNNVLAGYGLPLSGPIPPNFGIDTGSTTIRDLEGARDVLRAAGWKVGETSGVWEKKVGDATTELRFTIATVNTPVFEKTADLVAEQWRELGVGVEVRQYDQTDLTQTLIRPRKFEALLFGTAVGRELDFYSFWHSSQRSDPGLNIALYASITADSILSEARTLSSRDERTAAYERFATEIREDTPASFLYVPDFLYVAPTSVKDVTLTGISQAHERFTQIARWYIETDSVWPWFAN